MNWSYEDYVNKASEERYEVPHKFSREENHGYIQYISHYYLKNNRTIPYDVVKYFTQMDDVIEFFEAIKAWIFRYQYYNKGPFKEGRELNRYYLL